MQDYILKRYLSQRVTDTKVIGQGVYEITMKVQFETMDGKFYDGYEYRTEYHRDGIISWGMPQRRVNRINRPLEAE